MADLATTVQRWVSGASQGQTRYTEGVQATQVDVVGRAINAQGKLLANFQQSVTSGRWANRLGAVGNAGWKSQTIAKANNYSTGISAGESKYQAAMQVWLPRTQQIAAGVQAMPNASFQDSINRMTAFATQMHNAKLTG